MVCPWRTHKASRAKAGATRGLCRPPSERFTLVSLDGVSLVRSPAPRWPHQLGRRRMRLSVARSVQPTTNLRKTVTPYVASRASRVEPSALCSNHVGRRADPRMRLSGGGAPRDIRLRRPASSHACSGAHVGRSRRSSVPPPEPAPYAERSAHARDDCPQMRSPAGDVRAFPGLRAGITQRRRTLEEYGAA